MKEDAIESQRILCNAVHDNTNPVAWLQACKSEINPKHFCLAWLECVILVEEI